MKTTHKRFDEEFTFEGSGDWIDEDKLDAHKVKAFIDQELAEERKRIVEMVNKKLDSEDDGTLVDRDYADFVINLITKEQ